jgi:hypothetical protein
MKIIMIMMITIIIIIIIIILSMEKDSLGVTLILRASMNQHVMKHHKFNSVNLKIEIHWDMTTETLNEREPAVIQSKKRFPKGRLTTLTECWRSEEMTSISEGK